MNAGSTDTIDNLTKTMTASGGRAVLVQLVPRGTGPSYFYLTASAEKANVFIKRGGDIIGQFTMGKGPGSVQRVPTSSISLIDYPPGVPGVIPAGVPAGDQIYQVDIEAVNGNVSLYNCRLVTVEL